MARVRLEVRRFPKNMSFKPQFLENNEFICSVKMADESNCDSLGTGIGPTLGQTEPAPDESPARRGRGGGQRGSDQAKRTPAKRKAAGGEEEKSPAKADRSTAKRRAAADEMAPPATPSSSRRAGKKAAGAETPLAKKLAKNQVRVID